MDQKPIDYFKDWSNYLLVTTVAALGWVTTKEAVISSISLPRVWLLCVLCLTLSVVFGIFTLALIPLVAEQRAAEESFYYVDAEFNLLGRCHARLKWVCFPQHVLFILGVLLYGGGTGYGIGTGWKPVNENHELKKTAITLENTAITIQFNPDQIKEISQFNADQINKIKTDIIEIRNNQTEIKNIISPPASILFTPILWCNPRP
jgi:hypothetical protein